MPYSSVECIRCGNCCPKKGEEKCPDFQVVKGKPTCLNHPMLTGQERPLHQVYCYSSPISLFVSGIACKAVLAELAKKYNLKYKTRVDPNGQVMIRDGTMSPQEVFDNPIFIVR